VFRVKGSGTPVQCASTDMTVDPVTGHLLLRQTTPSGLTANFDVGGNTSALSGRKLLQSADGSVEAGRRLMQGWPGWLQQPVVTMNPICTWHSPDFWNSATGTYLTGSCSQFAYANKANVPMLSNYGQTESHYYAATFSAAVTGVAYFSFGGGMVTAICQVDMYRMYFSTTSWLDFCFRPWPVCASPTAVNCCSTGNCPTAPFVNYAKFQFDSMAFDLPCVLNKYGQVGFKAASGNVYKSDACLHLIGEFPKGAGDPLYRMSQQLPTNNVGSKAWFPYGTTTTDSANGANPKRRLQSSRQLLARLSAGGNS
jgi:hypothetical protein